jgi:two-component system nitrate/nitrite response regulator NarL
LGEAQVSTFTSLEPSSEVHEPTRPVACVLFGFAEVWARGLTQLLDEADPPTTAQEASTPHELRHAIVESAVVDVVITQAEALSPEFAAALVCDAATRPSVLVLLKDLSAPTVDKALSYPADGFLALDTLTASMLRGALTALRSGHVLAPAELFHDLLSRPGQPVTGASSGGAVSLTGRETDVLVLMCEGLANKQIAKELAISESGVKHHKSAVLSKLGARNRAFAARRAQELGLLSANAYSSPRHR